MKSFSRTIVVWLVFILGTAAVAMVEKPVEPVKPTQPRPTVTAGETVEDEMAAAKRQMKAAEEGIERAAQKIQSAGDEQEIRAAEREMDRAAKKMERAATRMNEIANRRMARDREIDARQRERERQWVALQQLDRYAGPVLGRDAHAGRVLVIPAGQIETEHLVTIMEDMSIMLRILHKKVGGLHQYSAFGDLPVFSRDRGGVQCIYLEGYGALFLIKVDFPLAPSVQTQEQEETEEPTDPLWEETRQEIFTSPKVIERRRIRLYSVGAHEYDADKVENLKSTLIKALKHAVNIRNLEPDEWVILTVIGEDGLPDKVGGCAGCHQRDDRETEPGQNGCPAATVMTVRVKKSDVDAFAKGELDSDEFRQKVQVLMY